MEALDYPPLDAGAAGFLLKATSRDRLGSGIHTVADGEALIAPIEDHVHGPSPHDGVPDRLRGLTQRELEVFALIAQGLSNDEIATVLVVASQSTVKTLATGYSTDLQ